MRLQRLSECLSLAEIAPAAALYSPMAAPRQLPHAEWPRNSAFHASALCSVAFDSVTLRTRLLRHLPGSCDMSALAQLLVR